MHAHSHARTHNFTTSIAAHIMNNTEFLVSPHEKYAANEMHNLKNNYIQVFLLLSDSCGIQPIVIACCLRGVGWDGTTEWHYHPVFFQSSDSIFHPICIQVTEINKHYLTIHFVVSSVYIWHPSYYLSRLLIT